MRFPTGATGSIAEFDRDWYNAMKFGEPQIYGFHDGNDINLRTGGDSDLGQEVKAIANGTITYFHLASHPTYGFGRHLVEKIVGAWGTRWIHYAHLQDVDFHKDLHEVSEGEIIGRIGKSGTTVAHLHFAIYKVDPIGFGIDNVPNNLTELNQNWEDPQAFIRKWITAPAPTPQPDIRLTLLNQAAILTEGDTRRAIDRDKAYPQLETEKNALQGQYAALETRYSSLKTRIKSAVDSVQ